MIPTNDRGLLLGDGLFETLLAVDGLLVDLEHHLDRMECGCRALDFPPLDQALARKRMEAALSPLGRSRAAVRLTLTAGSGGRGLDRPAVLQPTLFATAVLAPKDTRPLRLALVGTRRNEGSTASRMKTLGYTDNLLARAEARALGADEAVMLNNRDEVTCAAAANLFWIRDGGLETPALDCGALPGVIRRQVIDLARAEGIAFREVRASSPVLDNAQALFLTNSLIKVRAVCGLGGRDYGPHAMVDRLATLLAGD